jgi:hypothetical protein
MTPELIAIITATVALAGLILNGNCMASANRPLWQRFRRSATHSVSF